MLSRHLGTTMAVLGAVLASGVAMTAPALATVDEDEKVGRVQGAYFPAPDRLYRGYRERAAAKQCVVVERKSSTIGWTTTHVIQGNCGSTGRVPWEISNDGAVQTTVAIRLIVIWGPNTNSFVNLCNTKSQCLAMR